MMAGTFVCVGTWCPGGLTLTQHVAGGREEPAGDRRRRLATVRDIQTGARPALRTAPKTS